MSDTQEKMFPIQTQRDAPAHPLLIPWSIAELAYSVYSARYGKEQSLECLASRGGFGPGEMDMFLPAWRGMCSYHAGLSDKIVKLEGDLAHTESRREAAINAKNFATRTIMDHQSTIENLTADNARLNAIVGYLPKTADGVPITDGSITFCGENHSMGHRWRIRDRNGLTVAEHCEKNNEKQYSTREAAQKASK